MEKLTVQDLVMFLGCDCAVHRVNQDLRGHITLELLLSYENDMVAKRKSEWYITDIKPILRPLSDFTEEEKKYISDIADRVNYRCFKDVFEGKRVIGLSWDKSSSLGFLLNAPAGFGVAEIQKYLIQKHFDIFNWIEKGLAIDKTKIIK